jgi:hypothetical protein
MKLRIKTARMIVKQEEYGGSILVGFRMNKFAFSQPYLLVICFRVSAGSCTDIIIKGRHFLRPGLYLKTNGLSSDIYLSLSYVFLPRLDLTVCKF